MSKPTLSVIMCNYNHGDYIGKALESILTQSLSPSEVIVVDDGSTDNSIAVIQSFAKNYSNLKLLRNDKNMGVNYSINRALKAASGDYITAQSCDDFVLPGFFEKSIDLLLEHPQAALSCSNPVIFFTDGLLKEKQLGLSKNPRYFSSEELVKVLRKKYFLIAGNTSIIKREELHKAGDYKSDLKWHCDWFALYVMAFRKGICYIPEPLTALRILPTSYSSLSSRKSSDQLKALRAMLYMLNSEKYCDVKEAFKQSDVLSIYGLELLYLTLGDQKHREFFRAKAFAYAIKQLLRPFVPQYLKNLNKKRLNILRNKTSVCLIMLV